MTTTLYIKNMVCSRCIHVVQEELTALGLHVERVGLGEAILKETDVNTAAIRERLHANGFELLETESAKLVEMVKTVIIELAQSDELSELGENLSGILAKRIGRDYAALSHIFSSVEALTIERYFILQKIERVKELLTYGELSASEIAYKLGYSSPAHLSRQFKQTTGFTPTEFKRTRAHQYRIPLEEIGVRNL
ncbi:MAG: AraC family transcriptional regulator [Candidatus Kapaibacterium sp.]|nr:MAG: AraC family transcriptional regulator [Candidatus Kapabacteria bacterium]